MLLFSDILSKETETQDYAYLATIAHLEQSCCIVCGVQDIRSSKLKLLGNGRVSKLLD
jgi:hypothetical protein